MNIIKTVEIAASPEILWALLTDIEQIKRWTPSLVSDEPISSGPTKVGTLSKMKIQEGSKIVEYESEITVYQPNNELGMVLRGGSLGKGPMSVDYHLATEGANTIISYEVHWKAHGLLLKLMSPIITKMSQKNANNAMNLLKKLAEEQV